VETATPDRKPRLGLKSLKTWLIAGGVLLTLGLGTVGLQMQARSAERNHEINDPCNIIKNWKLTDVNDPSHAVRKALTAIRANPEISSPELTAVIERMAAANDNPDTTWEEAAAIGGEFRAYCGS
jgi:hypothetical protein